MKMSGILYHTMQRICEKTKTKGKEIAGLETRSPCTSEIKALHKGHPGSPQGPAPDPSQGRA